VEFSRTPSVDSVRIIESGSAIEIKWDGKASQRYSSSWLQRARFNGDFYGIAPLPMPQTLNAIPCFSHSDLVGGSSKPKVILESLLSLNQYGLVRVIGCPTEDKLAVESLAAALGGAPMRTIYGDSWTVEVQEQPINVAYTSGELALHQDLAYYESPPGLQLLLCREFDEGVLGGESTFADAFAMAEAFRMDHSSSFETLSRIPTTFQKVHYARERPAHIMSSRPIFDLGWGGVLTSVFWAPPFEGLPRIPCRDVEPYYAAYAQFAAWVESVEQGRRPGLLQFRTKKGDAIVFNQRRILHGRRGFSFSGEGKRVLQGCYVQADEWLSQLRAMLKEGELHGEDVRLCRSGVQHVF